jgi:hypothetical protein
VTKKLQAFQAAGHNDAVFARVDQKFAGFADLPEAQHLLADRVNRLRDRLDELLFGFQDYGMVGEK